MATSYVRRADRSVFYQLIGKGQQEKMKEIVEAFEGVPSSMDLIDKWPTMSRQERSVARKAAAERAPVSDAPAVSSQKCDVFRFSLVSK